MAGMPDAVEGVPNPLTKQRELMDLLSQETRHLIIQTILGHPEHLPSADELDYIIANKTKKSITDQLDRLQEAGIIAEYSHEPNRSKRGLPWKFYGLTEHGVEVLGQFNYLQGVPMMRAVIKKTRTTDRVERHMSAPRPSLPTAVAEALRIEDGDSEANTTERAGRSAESPTIFFSYAYDDHDRAQKIINGLREREYDVWVGDENIDEGDEIVEALQRGIEQSDMFVVLLSENSVEAPWIDSELGVATAQQSRSPDYPILPILLDDSDVPELLHKSQYTDVSESIEEAVDVISDAIDKTAQRHHPADVRVRMSGKSAIV